MCATYNALIHAHTHTHIHTYTHIDQWKIRINPINPINPIQ
jgi:hypothetical protein